MDKQDKVRKKLKIDHRIIIIISAIILISITLWQTGNILYAINYSYVDSDLKKIAIDIESAILKNPILGTTGSLGITNETIRDSAMGLLPDDNEQLLTILNRTKEQYKADLVYVLNKKGKCVGSTYYTIDKNITGNYYDFRPYFKRAIRGENFVYIALGVTTNKRGIYFASPIYSSNNSQKNTIIGVMVIKMGAGLIDNILTTIKSPVLFVSPSGIVFAANKEEFIFKKADPVSTDQLQNLINSKQFGSIFLKRTPLSIAYNFGKNKVIYNKKIYSIFRKELVIKDEHGYWQIIKLVNTENWYPVILKIFIISLITILTFQILIILKFNQHRKEALSAAKELKKYGEKMAITLDSIGDGVIVCNTRKIITRMNPVAEKLTGWSFEEGIGQHYLNVFKLTGTNNVNWLDPVSLALEKEKNVELDTKIKLISKNEMEFIIACSASPITDKKGKIIGVILIFKDITRERKLQEKLRQSEKMQTVGILAGGVAHDFNNLLLGIKANAELLQSETTDTNTIEYINEIITISNRARDLTSQLLSFSRRGKMQSVCFDLHGIVNEVVKLLSHTIDKRIEIKKNLQAQQSTITGDPTQVQTSILNIGVNARDAMPEGGNLIITSTNEFITKKYITIHNYDIEPGNYIKLSIKDTGVGMDKDHLKRIFEPFFTTKNIGKGIGLGLSAVYGMIKDHYGHIRVKSEKGRGAEFILLFPIYENTQNINNEYSANADIFYGSGTVLFVDDEKLNRTVVRKMLTKLGYTPILASNGEEAVNVYKENKNSIDLILLDIMMPKMNGTQAYHSIKKINPDIKVIITSGFSVAGDVQKLLDAGASGFIQKPFSINDLSKKLKEVLDY